MEYQVIRKDLSKPQIMNLIKKLKNSNLLDITDDSYVVIPYDLKKIGFIGEDNVQFCNPNDKKLGSYRKILRGLYFSV